MILDIKNFMCHTQLTLKLAGFTLISGKNGSGKSAILHAISWLINGGTNKHVTEGEKYCHVEITINGVKVKRQVDKSNYSLYLNGIEISTTKESLAELGRHDIVLAFYSQFDRLYLLSETPAARADMLNELFDIENLEIGLNNLNKDLKEVEKIVNTDTEQLAVHAINIDSVECSLKAIVDGHKLVSVYSTNTDLINKYNVQIPIIPKYTEKFDVYILACLKYADLMCISAPSLIASNLSIVNNSIESLRKYRNAMACNIKLTQICSKDLEYTNKVLESLNRFCSFKPTQTVSAVKTDIAYTSKVLESLNRFCSFKPTQTVSAVKTDAESLKNGLRALKEYHSNLCKKPPIEIHTLAIKHVYVLSELSRFSAPSVDSIEELNAELLDINKNLKGSECPTCHNIMI